MSRKHSERVIRTLLEDAEITINGSSPWDIAVHDPRLYDRLLQDSHLGLGEAYMEGWWDCEAIDQMIHRVLLSRIDQKVKGNISLMLYVLKSKLLNLQRPSRSFEVGKRHYDLGNDLYQAMLDKGMNYTCGYWKNARDLNTAQEAKLELVCRKTGLKPGMKVLELGCGWGGFAEYAARNYGVSVTGVTVSKQQVSYGMERCKGLPVELRLQDYREVSGTFDVVLSIGIIEHVGYRNYRTYMETADRCLKEGGIAFIHTIGGNVSRTSANSWTNTYIFPNGMLPSISQLGKAMEGLFIIEDLHNFGPDYDLTLMEWHKNFENRWPELKKNYDERFYRMWRYYLLTCAGGFRARNQQLWQMVMTRPGTPQPDCRFS